ncbi:UMP kinase [Allobaculum mucilyticum]|uniref:UMP kinase n=1 Tax=Allobaculum mucilyticum TaxID=2834459 RepID=UPI001E29F46C|nr:UMP kinase [Allobaculum mucilyticum]UNT95757.1 UMP kinase [Allobaculum mucilyticum]
MYKRVLLKLSGEALSSKEINLDPAILKSLAKELKKVKETGVELAIVVGGGNFIRGKQIQDMGMNRAQADYMGMLGTVINALAVQNALENEGVDTRVQTAVEMQKVAEPFILRRALRHLEKGRVVIFGAGTGSPYFSTDTTAALRASEIDADVILMAKNGVDGVYDSDPKTNPDAKRFDHLTYMDLLSKDLKVMDSTAISMCMDNDIDLVVFNMNQPGNIEKAVLGEVDGTTITKDPHLYDRLKEETDKVLAEDKKEAERAAE